MRWKLSHRDHDPRHIDLIAVIALLVVVVAACRYLAEPPQTPVAASFIVPSQSVRW